MKYFFTKLTAFLMIVVLSQIVLARYFISPVPEAALLNGYLKTKTQVLYFGDSVLQATDKDDRDKSSIAIMLSRLNPSLSFGIIAQGAFEQEMYSALLDTIARYRTKPQIVVLPINLRSFSPEWDRRPEYQFEKKTFFFTTHIPLLGYFYKPLAIFRAINVNTISHQEFLKTPVYCGTRLAGTVADFEDPVKFKHVTPETIRNKFIYHYMYDLKRDHRKLRALERSVELARKAGIDLCVYITPIDIHSGVNYVGPEFKAQLMKNVSVICSMLQEKETPCLNLSMCLNSSVFTYQYWPNEHLKEEGRRFVASKINELFFLKPVANSPRRGPYRR